MIGGQPAARVGIVGTGFVARGLASLIRNSDRFRVSGALTRRDPDRCVDFPLRDKLLRSVDQLVARSDVIVECSGDPVHAADVTAVALEAGLPVVTMDAEFHVTAGSYFIGRGLLTEAAGDQPGVLAELNEEAVAMGFRPIVYGNVKGYLNTNPSLGEMRKWAQRQRASVDQTMSWTDGTKVQFEQALVCNGLGATIARAGLLAPRVDDLEEAVEVLANAASLVRQPVADFAVINGGPPGVFIAATHGAEHAQNLRNLKLGSGPYYTLLRPFHLGYLEILKTIDRVMTSGRILLNNGSMPRVSVAAVAKRPLNAGTIVRKGIGSLDVRGTCVLIDDSFGHVPIGLLSNAVVHRAVSEGEILSFDDVEIVDSLALQAWRMTERRARLHREPELRRVAKGVP